MSSHSSWLTRKLRYFLQYRLTPVGQMAVFLMFLSASGVITVEIPIYQIFCGIVALFGVVEFCGTLFRPRLHLTVTFPPRITTGETAVGLIAIENRGYFPAYDLMVGCFLLPAHLKHVNAHEMIPALRRGERAMLPVKIQADRRGEYGIPHMWVHSTFPLNFMRVGNTPVPISKLIVVPAFQRLEQFEIPISHRYQHGGMLLESRSGNAAEYVGNREYIPGEPTKRLDFRAWARVGKPVVREYQEEFCSRVAIVLDTQRHSRWRTQESRQEFEAALSLTAAIVDSLESQGTVIELFAAGPDLFFFQSEDTQADPLESVLEILAGLEPIRFNPFDQVTPAITENLESTSVVICLFTNWDPSREALTDQILRSGCSLRVLLIRERPPTHPFPDEKTHMVLSPSQILRGDVCIL